MLSGTIPGLGPARIKNTLGVRPKTFGIGCLLASREAIEIKWRDAATDSDPITKESTRLQALAAAGYRPVRLMFHYPDRTQAIRVPQTLETLYAGLKGQGESIRSVLAANPRLERVRFPSGRLDLNPQEHVWKATREPHCRTNLIALAGGFETHLKTTQFPCSLLDKRGHSRLCARFK